MTNGDDYFFAKEVSVKIAEYVESASVKTTDNGSISAGTFSGNGNGSMKVNFTICKNIIYSACLAMIDMDKDGDSYLAKQMANGVDKMVTEGNINTIITGTVIPQMGSPFPMSGTGKGKFSGTRDILRLGFLSAFNAMKDMTENGDAYMATQVTNTITKYLQSGSVSTQGADSLLGTVGIGTVN